MSIDDKRRNCIHPVTEIQQQVMEERSDQVREYFVPQPRTGWGVVSCPVGTRPQSQVVMFAWYQQSPPNAAGKNSQ